MSHLPGVKPIEHRDDLGRPTDYRPEYDAQAAKLCELGATNADLAEFFNVTERTIENWQVRNESFAIASRVGKIHADEKVKVSAYKLAKGYSYIEQQAIKVKTGPHSEEVRIIEVEKHVPPNAMMQAKWLAVRGNKEFAEKTHVEHSGSIATKFDPKDLTDEQLARYVAFMESLNVETGE